MIARTVYVVKAELSFNSPNLLRIYENTVPKTGVKKLKIPTSADGYSLSKRVHKENATEETIIKYKSKTTPLMETFGKDPPKSRPITRSTRPPIPI